MFTQEKKEEVKQVLVVEDDAGIVAVYRDLLKNHCSITACSTIDEASKTLQAHTFELLLLDLGLPDGHGLHFLGAAKKHCPTLPVIVISGECYGAMENMVKKGGANACFLKPFDSDELKQEIKKLLM